MPRPTVFISYSREDKRWKDKLVAHLNLKPLEREGLLSVWDDQQIRAGQDWYEKIREAIAGAKVGILLVSSDFLNSDFIQREEVPRLLERQGSMVVFPVIVRPCVRPKVGWLGSIQARLFGGKALSELRGRREAALAQLAEEILGCLGGQEEAPASDPFLEAYRQGLSALFSLWDLSTVWVAQAGGANAAPLQATLDDMYLPLRLAKGYDIRKTDQGSPPAPPALSRGHARRAGGRLGRVRFLTPVRADQDRSTADQQWVTADQDQSTVDRHC